MARRFLVAGLIVWIGIGCTPRAANDEAERGGAGNAGAPSAGSTGHSGAAGMGGSGASHGGTSGTTTGGRGNGGDSGSSGSGGDTSVGGAGEGGEDAGRSGAGPLGGSGGSAGNDDGGGGGDGGDGVGGASDGGDGAGGAGDEGADLAIRQVVREYYLVGRATSHDVFVENRGPAPSHGAVIVENLPSAAFLATEAPPIPWDPSPWTCETIAGTLTCELAEPIAPASPAPPLRLLLTASTHEGSPLENTVVVRSEADTHPESDRSTELLTVHRPVDLAIAMDFPAYSTTAIVTVTNVSDAPTFSRVHLGCGGFPVSWVSGATPDTNDWTCGPGGIMGSGLSCARTVPLAPGAPTTIRVGVSSNTAPEGYLFCELSTEGDVNPDNNEIAIQGGSRT